MALLVWARGLVARVPFARWRGALGPPAALAPGDGALRRDANLEARRLARAVDRAAARLPGETRCLPRAMVLLWLLRRRGINAVLTIGVREGQARGGLDDLHAWVTRDGEILIGASDQVYRPLYAAGYPP